MAQPRPELRRGRIIWATVHAGNSVAKERPVIVLTATADILPNDAFEAVAVTTTFSDPPPSDCIPLPWHPTGKTLTRLRRRSAAVLSWIDEVLPGDVISFGGDVPPQLMLEILNRLT